MIIEYVGHATYLVEAGGFRLLVDPWLTERLDRFWTHWPAIGDRALPPIDAIFLSHHHFDHHHFPSLARLPREALVLFPEIAPNPRFTGSGMGHQAIQWTLHRLGFARQRPLTTFEAVEIGPYRLTPVSSNVRFPEQGLLLEADGSTVFFAGDTMLHPATQEHFAAGDRPRVDLAVMPCHSVAPPGPLMLRRAEAGYDAFVERAVATFDQHVDIVAPQVTVAGAFGWKVAAGPDEEDFDWVNHLLFPFTPVQAYRRLRARGREALLLGPADRVRLARGDVAAEGPWTRDQAGLEAHYEAVALRGDTAVPAFAPRPRPGSRRGSSQRDLLASLLDALVGTDYWYRALAQQRASLVRLSGDSDTTYRLAPWQPAPFEPVAEDLDALPFTWLHEDTLRQLLDAELLLESSYGLWAGSDDLLSAAFHHPRYYVRYLDAWLQGQRPTP
jgi:L-ascorbate metabolism protein UlaG (beta-lactamase superfamily)